MRITKKGFAGVVAAGYFPAQTRVHASVRQDSPTMFQTVGVPTQGRRVLEGAGVTHQALLSGVTTVPCIAWPASGKTFCFV